MTETSTGAAPAAWADDDREPRVGTFTRDTLLGAVAARYLRDRLASDGAESGADGTARFIIDVLSESQTAAIARGILADPELAPMFEIKLPRHFMEGSA